jgi:outer membrane protein OmpA-like peptidoglycan-associated protein
MARLPGERGDIYVSLQSILSDYADVDCQPVAALQVLEEKPLAPGKVKAGKNAETMAADIDEKGTVRLYGIHFDADKVKIKEKSESVLAGMAELLQQNPDLKLRVVGHTDATGSMEHNMELSKQRARAVVDFLSTEHGIPEDRIPPHGVGPLAPVASNEDESGRSRKLTFRGWFGGCLSQGLHQSSFIPFFVFLSASTRTTSPFEIDDPG